MTRAKQNGVVLVLAVILMAGVLLIGIAALDTATVQGEAQDLRYHRLVASTLADGGIDLGYQRLAEVPSYRGTFTHTTSGGASFDVRIESVADGVEIVSEVSGAGASRRRRAYLRQTSGPRHQRAMEIENTLSVSWGTFTIDSEAIVGRTNLNLGTGSVVGPVTEGVGSSWTMNLTADDATRVITGSTAEAAIGPDQTFASDVTLIEGGKLELIGPNVTLTGTVFVDGTLSIKGTGKVRLGTPEAPIVLMTRGPIVTSEDPEIEIFGAVFVEDSVWFGFVPPVVGTGVFYTKGSFLEGSLHVSGTSLTWTFDPSVPIPPWVSGLSVSTDDYEYVEEWRRDESNSGGR